MSQKDKLLKKLLAKNSSFSFPEAVQLLGYYSYILDNKGRTSGSRVIFTSSLYSAKLMLHRPHPHNELKQYQIRQLIEFLQQENLI